MNPQTASKINLPLQITSFVGREREISEVHKYLKDTPLLTLTGAGGTGKTRLALKAVAELENGFDDGVYFVDLSPITQPDLFADTVNKALGLTEITGQPAVETLKTYIRDKNLLLILDNFEQIVEAAPQVTDLLASAPKLKIMVTSREALNIYGEQRYPVNPLAIPSGQDPFSIDELINIEAIKLFLSRARSVNPDFTLDEGNAKTIAAICGKLDGLPLAIELASARLKIMDPESLLDQLEDRISALKGGPRDVPMRQQTLEAAIAWSYDLLDDVEKILFARLSVFMGGHSFKAAQAVCAYHLPIEVMDGLESLLDKSLVRKMQSPTEQTRFGMLGTIHAFARERLRTMGESDFIRKKHAEFFTGFAELVQFDIRAGPKQMHLLKILEADHDNLRAALEWSFGGGEIAVGLRLVAALGHFWYRKVHKMEGKRWTSSAMKISNDAPALVRARIFDASGVVAFSLQDQTAGKQLHQEALALYQELGNPRDIGWILIWIPAHSVGVPDEYDEAIKIGEKGIALLREEDDLAGVSQGLNTLGELARVHGDLDRAEKAYIEAHTIATETDDTFREVMQVANLGFLAQARGDNKAALSFLRQALEISIEMEHVPLSFFLISGISGVIAKLNDLDLAARLQSAAEQMFETHGLLPQSGDAPTLDENKKFIMDQLDPVEYKNAYEAGRQLKFEQAVKLALDWKLK